VYGPWILGLLLSLPAAGDPGAGREQPPEHSDDVVVLRRCVVDHERVTLVGPGASGSLKESFVEPGSEVKKGQILGRLGDEAARAEVQLRETEAKSTVDVRINESKHAIAENRLKITASLMKRNVVSREEFTQQRLEAEQAGLEIENAKHRRKLAEAQLKQAQALLHDCELASPHDGVVTEVLRRPGEPIAPNQPVFRVVEVDHLLITGQVDVVDVWRIRPGQAVRIIPEIGGADLPVEHEVFEGRIFFVDTRIDPLSQTCKVLAKCDNRERLLRAGLEARMEIQTGGPSAKPVGNVH